MNIIVHRAFLPFALVCILFAHTSVSLAQSDSDGHAIEFLINAPNQKLSQVANIQYGKILVKRVGGDTARDMLFEADKRVLYVIDHRRQTYLKIDQILIDKVASLLEGLSAGQGQGGLADLLTAMGLTNEPEIPSSIKALSKPLQAAGISCRVFQFYQQKALQSEVCLAEQNTLPLGNNLVTLRDFYQFGEQIRRRAGKILSFLGVNVPAIQVKNNSGLPILIYSVSDKTKTSLKSISASKFEPLHFSLPTHYVQTSLPFLG